jgi:nucleotide-binding universal stress UspA family protein
MKSILLPTDFSRNAWHAIAYALMLFKDETCTFYLLHTYAPAFYRMDYMMGGPEVSAIPDVGVDLSLMGLETTLADIQRDFPNPLHRFELLSAFNTLTDEIRDVVERKGIDLVVMGTRGASGAKAYFLGSNTVFVLRKVQVPVLVVPADAAFQPIRTMLLPSDYLHKYRRKEIRLALDLAKGHQSRVILLHVGGEDFLTDDQRSNKLHLERLMEDLDYEFAAEHGGEMPEAILRYSDEHPIDILVMLNPQHTFLERILNRQNVDQIGFHVKIPFLVLPDTSPINT